MNSIYISLLFLCVNALNTVLALFEFEVSHHIFLLHGLRCFGANFLHYFHTVSAQHLLSPQSSWNVYVTSDGDGFYPCRDPLCKFIHSYAM